MGEINVYTTATPIGIQTALCSQWYVKRTWLWLQAGSLE